MKSISYKIAFGYFVIIFINVTITLFAIYYLNRLSSPVEQSLEEKIKNVTAAESMIQSLVQLELVQYEQINKGYNPALDAEFHTYKNEFLNWHQRAIEGVSETMDIQSLDSILTGFNKYIRVSETIQKQLSSLSEQKSLKQYYYQAVLPILKNLESRCTRLVRLNRNAIEKTRQKADQLSDLAKTIIIVFSILAVVFSITASVYFTNKVVKPIKRTINSVRKIGEGQLNQKILISSNDEIAELGKEFNKMTDRLYAYEQMNIRQILAEKRKSEAIVAEMPVSILVTDKSFRLSLINEPAKKLLHLKGKKWAGKAIDQIIKDRALIRLLCGKNNTDGKDFDPSKSIITLEGIDKPVYLLARQVRITDAEDGVTAIVTMLQDVTSFKELDQLKSEFIAIISHQIKTPLTSIIMLIDILLKEVKGRINEDQRELLSDAKFDSIRLKDFIFNLLQFSRLETGKIGFNLTEITGSALQTMIDNVIKSLQPKIDNKQAIILKDFRPPSVKCRLDVQHFSLVLSNIIDNALTHIEPSGKIEIRVEQSGDAVQFSIKDNGEGIPEKKIPFIFDKFVQANEFKNNEGGSIGLGLAIAKEIVKGHEGEIWVSSKIGEGSTFYIKLPAGE